MCVTTPRDKYHSCSCGSSQRKQQDERKKPKKENVDTHSRAFVISNAYTNKGNEAGAGPSTTLPTLLPCTTLLFLYGGTRILRGGFRTGCSTTTITTIGRRTAHISARHASPQAHTRCIATGKTSGPLTGPTQGKIGRFVGPGNGTNRSNK